MACSCSDVCTSVKTEVGGGGGGGGVENFPSLTNWQDFGAALSREQYCEECSGNRQQQG